MNTTNTTCPARRVGEQVGTNQGLLEALERIDVEGWDGRTGRVVLDYARENVVGPLVGAMGFVGADAEFAEATGWGAAWEALRAPSMRTATSPWGAVNTRVRHAVLGELMAEKYGTSARSAWRVHRFRQIRKGLTQDVRGDWKKVADPTALARPTSLTALLVAGFDPVGFDVTGPELGDRLEVIVDLLASHGWTPALARTAIEYVAEHARPNPAGRPRAHGWQEMAIGLGIPTWQARRVTVLLLGAPGWPGLVERLVTGGEAALTGAAIEAAVRSTCEEQMRPPARVAKSIESRGLRLAS